MRELLDQIDSASGTGLHLLALAGAMTVPDIAGALASSTGEARPSLYEGWVRENLPSWSDKASARALREYRNAILHQHRGAPDPHKGHKRLAFVEPSNVVLALHHVTMENGDESVFFVSIPDFCTEMTTAARAWLRVNEERPVVKSNLLAAFRRHPHGLPGLVTGVALFA